MSDTIAQDRYKSILRRNAHAKTTLKNDAFIAWYGDDTHDRQCEYCLIKESQIKTLLRTDKIKTKRITTRGRTMEVDRKNPRGHYEISNLVMSCYWCNNAKTDEFTYEEFRSIACKIHPVWKDRLEQEPLIPQKLASHRLRCDWDKAHGIVIALPWGLWSGSNEKVLTNNADYINIQNLIGSIRNADNNLPIYLVYKDSSDYARVIGDVIKDYEKDQNVYILPISQLRDWYLRGTMPFVMIDEATPPNLLGVKAVYTPSFYDNSQCTGCQSGYREYSFYEHIAALEIAESLDLPTRYLSKEGSGYWYKSCDDEFVSDVAPKDRPIILNANDLVHNGTCGYINAIVFKENLCKEEGDKDALLERIKESLNLKELQPICNIDVCKTLSDYLRFEDKETLLCKNIKSEDIPAFESCNNITKKAYEGDIHYIQIGEKIEEIEDLNQRVWIF